MKWLATVDNGTSIETCPYFARAITLDATSVMALPASGPQPRHDARRHPPLPIGDPDLEPPASRQNSPAHAALPKTPGSLEAQRRELSTTARTGGRRAGWAESQPLLRSVPQQLICSGFEI